MAGVRRYAQLTSGLVLFGVSIELMLVANLGLDPWDVLHQGIARRTGVPIGTVVVVISLVVLTLWIPLRQRPGVGTVGNAILVGLVVDLLQPHLHTPGPIAARVAYLAGGIAVNGVATGLYIGAGLGPGPRDGLMTGLARRGHSLRGVRTCIELTVLAAGWLLGGSVGVATLVYAASIGPLAQFFIGRFSLATTTQTSASAAATTSTPTTTQISSPTATASR